ncbi:ArnT family glycosyltransferase [Acidobacteriota bacterium]
MKKSNPSESSASKKYNLENPRVVNILVFCLCFAALLGAKWIVLSAPFHWDVMGYIMPSANVIFKDAQIIPVGDIAGHPPLFFLTLTLIWKLFGQSLFISHLLNLLLGAFGLTFLFMLTRRIYGIKEAVAATLFLFFNQIFFAQVGMVYLSVAIMSLAILTVYSYICQKHILFLVSASAMLLVKETSIIVLVSIILFDVFQNICRKEKIDVLFKKLIHLSLAFLPLFGWMVFHWKKTGWIFNTNLIVNKESFWKVFLNNLSRYLFFDRSPENVNRANWGIFILVVVFFVVYILKKKNLRTEILLLFIVIMNIAFFSYTDDLPRYFLIIFPFYFILGARAFVYISEKSKYRRVLLIALLALIIFSSVMNYSGQRDTDGWRLESNMEYLDFVRVCQSLAHYLESKYPDYKIIASFPLYNALQIPWYGYVKKPLAVVPQSTFEEQENLFVIQAFQSNTLSLKRFIQENRDKLQIHREFSFKGKRIVIYRKRISSS